MRKVAALSSILTLALIHILPFPGFTAINPQGGDNYAMLYLYRTKSTGGGMTELRVHFNDRLIKTFKRGTKLSYKIYSEGELKITSVQLVMGNRIPGEDEFNVSITNGREYYFKLSAGILQELMNRRGK